MTEPSNGIQIRAQSAPWYAGIEIMIRQGNAIAVDIVMKIPEFGERIKPPITLGRREAQLLMDDLWHSGIRPTEGTGSSGSLRATEKHLEDMRRLVFPDQQQGPT